MESISFSQKADVTHARGYGALMLLVALGAGLAGGFFGMMPIGAPRYLADAHGLLLEYFVVIPAFLGGLGRIGLPASIGARRVSFHWMDWIALGLILSGMACAFMSATGWVFAVGASVLLSSCGYALLASTTLIFLLEEKTQRFVDMSIFAWSQLMVSIAVILTTPVAFVFALDMMSSHTTRGLLSVIESTRLPLGSISVAATVGMVAAALRPDCGRAKVIVISMLAILCVGLPLLWFKALTVGFSISPKAWAIGIAVPTLVSVGLFVSGLWHASQRMNVSSIWCAGSLVMLGAGWCAPWVDVRDAPAHSWEFLAVICALFGAFYRWQEIQVGHEIHPWVCVSHFVTYAVGVIMSLSPWQVLQALGHVMMALCLGFILLLFTRLIASAPRRLLGTTTVRVDG